MLVSGAWFFWLVTHMDLGEFTPMRGPLQVAAPVVTVLAILYMKEFLAVRALGIIGLLAAEPLLESAFLREEKMRLFLVSLVYVNIIAAMFWVGMPYLLRDLISWITASKNRWRTAAFAGFAYGVLLCVGGLFCAGS